MICYSDEQKRSEYLARRVDVRKTGSHFDHGASAGRENQMTNSEHREEREQVVRAHMEAENVHDFDTVIDTFSHPRYELIATDRTHDGEDAVREYFKETRSAFPDQRNELISLRHADDAVIVEFWLLGTHEGHLMGIPPTGRSFKCRMTAFFIFEGAKLTCERVYFDSATILRQLTA